MIEDVVLKEVVSSSEWQARCDLAALYRLIAHFRMTDLIDTHISVRVPNEPDHFLINRYGVLFDHMKASDLVKIDHDGNIVGEFDQGKNVNRAGFVIHSAIHHARGEVNCVIHTHTADGMAVSTQKNGLLPLTQHALKFYGCLSYHAYEGVALSLEERERLVADLGNNNAMVLYNHGLLAAGESVHAAFHTLYFLERACQAQIKAQSAGAELIVPSEAVCQHTAKQFADEDSPEYVKMVWDAALALIAHQAEDYCS